MKVPAYGGPADGKEIYCDGEPPDVYHLKMIKGGVEYWVDYRLHKSVRGTKQPIVECWYEWIICDATN
jgi:hypothetical protein